MKKRYIVEFEYANGRKDRHNLTVRNLDEAIKFVNSINRQTSMKARIYAERRVVWEYC